MQLPEPKIIGSIVFTTDYQVDSQMGNIGDPDALGIFLPTLVRSANMLGDLLEIGAFTGAKAHGAGRAFSMGLSDDTVTLNIFGSVYCFDSIGGETVSPQYSHYPILGETEHLAGFLVGLKGLHWFGFRDSESNAWQQRCLRKDLEPEAIQKATLMALQADILLKNHGLPRRRICMKFSDGTFHLWSAANDDIMMLVHGDVDAATERQIEQAGEAFLLGAVAS